MAQEDHADLIVALVIACVIIIFLLYIIVKRERLTKRAIKELRKPFDLNDSFVGRHFFVHGFYPRKQFPPLYEAFWLIEVRIEGKEEFLCRFKVTDQQAATLLDYPNKMFVLEKDSDKLSFRLVLDENELFFKLRHKE